MILLIASSGICLFFWFILVHYIILDFSSVLESVRSLTIIFFPLASSCVVALLLIRHLGRRRRFGYLRKYLGRLRVALHITLLLFLANIGVIFMVYKTSHAATCMTAAEVLDNALCLYMYNGEAYNRRSSSGPDYKPKTHKGHPCQARTSASAGTIYDATEQINNSYRFHIVQGYLTNTNRATNLGGLCASVSQSYNSSNHLRTISDTVPPVTPTVTPRPTPTPTRVPTPTPTRVPTPTPTRVPTPTPTPRPTAVPTATPVPPTPIPGSCTVSTSPAAVTFNVTGSAAVTAAITLSAGATVSPAGVEFSTYDTAVATVSPAFDLSGPTYATSVTGRVLGTTAVKTVVHLTGGGGCTTDLAHDTDVYVAVPTKTPSPVPSATPPPSPTLPPTPTPRPGDANRDTRVDNLDYAIWLANYYRSTTSGPAAGDFDVNGFVDGRDYTIWLVNYDQ